MAAPIPQHNVMDRVIWQHTKDGIFSVKSGYHFWHSNNARQVDVISSVGWKKLWDLPIPPKLKIFVWRLCRNNIPVRSMLTGRGIATPIDCPFCANDVEHLLHVFFYCNFASHCWQHIGLAYDMRMVEDAPTWLLEKLSSQPREVLVKIITALWGIWYFRNKKVWDNKTVTADVAMDWSSNIVAQWQIAKVKQVGNNAGTNRTSRVDNQKWTTPSLGHLKLNVDASVVHGASSFSVGMLIRDSRGAFIQGKTMRFRGMVSVFEAEAIGVSEALSWIRSLQLQHVTVETDSLLTIKALESNYHNHLEVGNCIESCRLKLQDRGDISIKYARKHANKAAHLMARIPCLVNSYNVIMSHPPYMLETLMYDSSSF